MARAMGISYMRRVRCYRRELKEFVVFSDGRCGASRNGNGGGDRGSLTHLESRLSRLGALPRIELPRQHYVFRIMVQYSCNSSINITISNHHAEKWV